MRAFQEITIDVDDIGSTERKGVQGYVSDDGIFYFIEWLGNMEFREKRWPEFDIVSVDFSNGADGTRFAMVGVK